MLVGVGVCVGVGATVGVAVDATANSGAGVGVGAGSPQATPVAMASARTPVAKYLFKPSPQVAGSACLGGRGVFGRIISSADLEADRSNST